MGAFGAAISGLQSSEQWLGVISNNVANSETVGFKAGELNFATLISQDLSSPSGDDSTQGIGGIDAMQVGLGVTVGDIATDLTQGSIETTGNVTDIAIQGQGYLTVKDGASTQYTRAGNLTFDSNGDLVTASGGLVQGWSLLESIQDAQPDAAAVDAYGTGLPGNPLPGMLIINTALNTSNTSAIGDIVVPNNLQLAALATGDTLDPNDQAVGVVLAGNLDSHTPDTNAGILDADGIDTGGAAGLTEADIQLVTKDANATSNFTVYDSLGTPSNFTVYWYQTANTPLQNAHWSYYIYDTTGGAAPSDTAVYPDAGAFILAGGVNGASNAAGVVTTMTDSVAFNNDGSLATNGNSTVIGENPVITLPDPDGAVDPFTFDINLGTPNLPGPPPVWGKDNGLTGEYGGGATNASTGIYTPNQTIYTKSVNGYEKGTLTGLSFNSTGGIEASFTNGQTIVIAQLALSNFTNPGGLESDGGNYFTATDNSGSIQIGTAGTDGFGSIQGGALEESNVQLSTELTNMILAQTMYQANAKVITTQGNLYDDLFNAIPQQ
jgi:flagellar hook protein FlgE